MELPLVPDVGWAVIDYLKYGRPKVDSSRIFVRHTAPFLPFAEGDHLDQLIRAYMVKAHIPMRGKHLSLIHIFRQIEQTRQHRNALETIKKAQLRKTLRSAASNLLSQDTPDYTQLFSAYCSNGMFQAYYLYLDISCSLSADTLDEHLSRLFHQFILGVNLVYYENQCNEFQIALYLSSDEKDLKPEETADKLENSLCSEIQYITPHQYTFGISMVNPNLCQAIHEAIFCMKHRVLCANKNRIHLGDIAAFASAKTDFSFLSDFKESLIRKDQNRLESTLKFMYHSIEESSICYEGLQNIYLRILVLLGEYCSPTVTQALQMPTEIYHFSSVWDWIDFLKELLTRFFETEKPLSVEDVYKRQPKGCEMDLRLVHV